MTTEAPQPDDAFLQILADLAAQEQTRLHDAKGRLRHELIPRLKQWGVAQVAAEYSGCGDSGCIDRIAYLDAAGKPVNMNFVKSASDPDIEAVLYEFLPAGFEINDGGQGTLTVDTQTAKVTIQHQENYTETRNSTREFDL